MMISRSDPPGLADVLYVPDLAQRMGLSEAAVRHAIQAGTGAVPPPFRLGRRRWAWRRQDVDRWLAEKAAEGARYVQR